MSKIKVTNFGPIQSGYQENNGWIDIKKVTVFTGNQGSGKSTLAKLISTFTWMEKALVRGDYKKNWFERKNRLKNQILNYHRLENYFKSNGAGDTFITYIGDAYQIRYEYNSLIVEENKNKKYALPQIMYVPAERNFITYVKTPKELKLSSESLKEFLSEFDKAKNELKNSLKLPLLNSEVEYDKLNDTLNLKGEGYKLKVTESSSGFQSFIPLFIVSRYLAKSVQLQKSSKDEAMSSDEIARFKKGVEDIWSNNNLTDEQKKVALSVLSSKFKKTSFINIVEEPEQNLFPSSQKKMLWSLLEFNNWSEENKLLMTSHSPYLIHYLTLAVKAGNLYKHLKDKAIHNELSNMIPENSTVKENDLAIYEMNESDGSIVKLKMANGIPSDNNELNQYLDDSNEVFAKLLEMEQRI